MYMNSLRRLNRRLDILRAAGAIADYRIMRLRESYAVQVFPGDTLMAGEELHQFVAEMLGSDIKAEHIAVVTAADQPSRSH
jgi:hypothetical protein